MVAREKDSLIFFEQTDMARGMSGCVQALQAEAAHFDYTPFIDEMEIGNRFGAVFKTVMIVQGFHEFVFGKAVDPGVIDHRLPAIIFVENTGVDFAEVDGAGFCGESRDKPRVVGVHMGDHEISAGEIEFELGDTGLHGIPAGRAVKSRIDDQIPVVSFNDIRVEFLERAVGKWHFNPVEPVHDLVNHQ
jgi:hypothetical protein